MTLTELENVDRRTRELHSQCSILDRGIAISTQTYLSLELDRSQAEPTLKNANERLDWLWNRSAKNTVHASRKRKELSVIQLTKIISVSYDGAWQKRGKARDSITGFGTIIGESTGKVLDFRVKSTRCRKCDCAVSDSTTSSHDCRRNHSGSSKYMEPEIAVVCFNDAPNHGIKYSSYAGDEDATTESHIKYRVNYDTAMTTDKNHATRTLGSRLYSAQNTVKGLTFVVIKYILKLFSYCVLQNQGKPEKLKQGMKSLVCHAFGEHGECDETSWGALKDPSSYQYKDLPGGKQLSDDNLRAAIENAIKPFQTDEWCEKLANCGSSQANECVNGVVATKAPKIRHYGSSESLNFHVASWVCQFNEGHEYLIQTTKHLGLEESKLKNVYVETETRKRKKEQDRKKKRSVKRRRKELKKAKARKNWNEWRERKELRIKVGLE